jgi:response regulator NasT
MKWRVLIVDDDLSSRRALVKALSQQNFEVAGEVSKGEKAAEICKKTSPDVVLMAVGLPDMDGIVTARNIMEKTPTPVVLLTSHYDSQAIERAKQAGVMGYLAKPLRQEELTPAIELAISQFQECMSLKRQNEVLKKTLEVRDVIDQAKRILMNKQRLSESEAFCMIRKRSMDMHKPMVEIAQGILQRGR